MNIGDFAYMWRGKSVGPLLKEEASLLKPVDLRRNPSGRALLLLHGFSSSPAIYRTLIPSLSQYDAVLSPVLAGHADCLASFYQSTAADWFHSAQQAYDSLSKDYEVIDVMGISLGGILGYNLSQQRKVHHLFLLAPAFVLKGPRWLQLMSAKLLRFLGVRYIPNFGGNFHMPDCRELTYRRLAIPAIIEMLTLVAQWQYTPPTCPIDLFLGRFDEVVDSNAVASLFKHSPDTTIHWLEHSAHILSLDGDIETIVACVKERYHHRRL